jgi:hypothetical protein
MLTLITKIFGVQGVKGDLHLKPTIDPSWFDESGQASVQIPFAGRLLRVVYHQKNDSEKLAPQQVTWNGQTLPTSTHASGLLIKRQDLLTIPDQGWQQLDITLA